MLEAKSNGIEHVKTIVARRHVSRKVLIATIMRAFAQALAQQTAARQEAVAPILRRKEAIAGKIAIAIQAETPVVAIP